MSTNHTFGEKHKVVLCLNEMELNKSEEFMRKSPSLHGFMARGLLRAKLAKTLQETPLPRIRYDNPEPDPIAYLVFFTMSRANYYMVTAADRLQKGEILFYGYLLNRDWGWKHILLEELVGMGALTWLKNFTPRPLSQVFPWSGIKFPPGWAVGPLGVYPRSNRWKPAAGTVVPKDSG